MKISISTKVFLGFIVVLLVFGFSSLYTVVRTSEIRDRVVLVREGIVPIEKNIQRATEELVTLRSLLMQRKPRERTLNRVKERLEMDRKSYFDLVRNLQNRSREVSKEAEQLNLDNTRLSRLSSILERIREGNSVAIRAQGGPDALYSFPRDGDKEYRSNEAVFSIQRQLFIENLNNGNIEEASIWYGELRMGVGEMLRSTRDLERTVSLCISEVNQEASRNEARVVRDVVFTSAVALAISIMIMFLTHQAIRRIRILITGVRSFSEGKYETPVSVTGGDEIAELAEEFSKMGLSLRERNKQLEEQSMALVRSERFATIGKISTLITHEIRNPLSSIGLNAELLEEEISQFEGCDTGESRALLKAIGGEVDRLRDVTEEYLQFARLPKPEKESIDVLTMINNIVQFVEPEMNQKNLKLTVTHEGTPQASIDGNQIRQALLNLLRNSSEAMDDKDGGQILIHIKAHDPETTMIRIEDSGPGVPFEIQPHIFEAFYSTKPSGTGMGLSLVQQIATGHGGEVRCQTSAALGGAKFVLLLPKDS